jgi:Tfp pilus assembly protein PilX
MSKKIKKHIRNNIKKFQCNSGQIILILVLVSVVGLTVGISLISRTITDVRISSQIEQSNRAFSAAEAGVESGLRGAVAGGPTGSVSLPGASANYSVSTAEAISSVFTLPLTEIGAVQTVWLIPHNEDGTINESGTAYPVNTNFDVCFGNVNTSSIPAIVVSYLYKEGGTYKVVKRAYDPDATRGNHFLNVDSAGNYCSSNYRYKKTITPTADWGINIASIPLALRIQALYANTTMAIKTDGNSLLPVQGKIISSIGQTQTGTVRKIQVTEGYRTLPALLDFTLFSEN